MATHPGIVALRITTSSSAEGAKGYYTQQRADYYVEGKKYVGKWGGKGAEKLGLRGAVDQEAFNRLVDNQDPITGKSLTPRLKENRRIGYDCTFFVPKGVSVIHGVMGDDRIEGLVDDCAQETMEEMEKDVQTRVRIGRRNEVRKTANLVCARFMHTTARPVRGHPDPLLHQHYFVFNATWDSEEKRWKALEFAAVKQDACYYQSIFNSKLAAKIQALGYGIHRDGARWDIDGIDETIIREFSRRTKVVEDFADAHDIHDPRRKAELGAKTRERKGEPKSAEELRQIWLSRLTPEQASQLKAVHCAALERRNAPEQAQQRNSIAAAANAVRLAVKKLETNASAWREREFLTEALQFGLGECSYDEISRAAQSAPLLRPQYRGSTWCTTETVMAEERNLLDFVRKTRGTCRPLAPNPPNQSGSILSDEQAEAVAMLGSTADRVIAVVGKAGGGKTTLMTQAAAMIKGSGRRLVALAPTTQARNKLKEEGFKDARTLQQILCSPAHQKLLKNAVIWVDEGGLISTPDLNDLFKLAAQHNARIILSGDTAQHTSVGRGDAMRLLLEHGGLQRADVKTIRRQKIENYRLAVQDLSEAQHRPGKGLSGLERLDRLGWIKEIADGTRYTVLADHFARTFEPWKSVAVIAPTHVEIRAATAAIRERLLSDGRLGKQEHSIDRLTSCNLTNADREVPSRYEVGQVVSFIGDCGEFKRGQRVDVVATTAKDVMVRTKSGEVLALPTTTPEKFTVFQRDTISIRIGDRVRITKNGRSADGKHLLPNGAIHFVNEITADGSLKLDSGAVIRRDWGHLDYGWVSTSIASQGSTVDHVFVVQSAASGRAANLQQLYVSASRGRMEATIYTDSKEELIEAAGRSGQRLLATELMLEASKNAKRAQHVAESYRRWEFNEDVANEQQQAAASSAPPEAPVYKSWRAKSNAAETGQSEPGSAAAPAPKDAVEPEKRIQPTAAPNPTISRRYSKSHDQSGQSRDERPEPSLLP